MTMARLTKYSAYVEFFRLVFFGICSSNLSMKDLPVCPMLVQVIVGRVCNSFDWRFSSNFIVDLAMVFYFDILLIFINVRIFVILR